MNDKEFYFTIKRVINEQEKYIFCFCSKVGHSALGVDLVLAQLTSASSNTSCTVLIRPHQV